VAAIEDQQERRRESPRAEPSGRPDRRARKPGAGALIGGPEAGGTAEAMYRKPANARASAPLSPGENAVGAPPRPDHSDRREREPGCRREPSSGLPRSEPTAADRPAEGRSRSTRRFRPRRAECPLLRAPSPSAGVLPRSCPDPPASASSIPIF
jgi:hypothetical protein